MVVEVRPVLGQHRHQMAAIDDQHPVQQFSAGSSDPSLGNRIRPRRPYRRPGTAGLCGDSQDVGAAGRVCHDEQHRQPLQQQGVDAEEVGGENAAGLHLQELPPAGPVAARRRIHTGPLKYRPHRAGPDLVAQPGQFAVDASIPPAGVLAASRSTNRRSSGEERRPPRR